MKLFRTLLAASMALSCFTAFAQWQWIDKDGRKVFSDRAPPSDILDKNILKRPQGRGNPNPASATPAEAEPAAVAGAPALPSSATKGVGVDKDLEAKKKQADAAEAAKRKAEEERLAKTRQENCTRAKQAKMSFDSGIRIAQTNASGEREILDDAARAAELKRIQGVIASECK